MREYAGEKGVCVLLLLLLKHYTRVLTAATHCECDGDAGYYNSSVAACMGVPKGPQLAQCSRSDELLTPCRAAGKVVVLWTVY